MDFYDWMLALHLLAAFAIGAALIMFSVMVVIGRRPSTTLQSTLTLFRIAPIGAVLIGAGSVLALILGVVLALKSDRFEIWNFWIIAALVLWAALGGIGQRTGNYYTGIQTLAKSGDGSEQEVLARLRAPTGMVLHLATVSVFVLLVLDMFFKPFE